MFILKDLKSRVIIIISNKTFFIVRKLELLINAINDFVVFYYFKMFDNKIIVYKIKNIKTQIIVFNNKKSMLLKSNAIAFS